MDTTFHTKEGVFNYRVCGIIINNNKILVTKDNYSPYYYLPGGRLNLHESANDAIVREMNEELDITISPIRPLWLNESFYIEEQNNKRYHEICIYYLVDYSNSNLLARGDKFTKQEGDKTLFFEWIDFSKLKDMYIYPNFIKTEIFNSLSLIRNKSRTVDACSERGYI